MTFCLIFVIVIDIKGFRVKTLYSAAFEMVSRCRTLCENGKTALAIQLCTIAQLWLLLCGIRFRFMVSVSVSVRVWV